jgi:hypothetical protein
MRARAQRVPGAMPTRYSTSFSPPPRRTAWQSSAPPATTVPTDPAMLQLTIQEVLTRYAGTGVRHLILWELLQSQPGL